MRNQLPATTFLAFLLGFCGTVPALCVGHDLAAPPLAPTSYTFTFPSAASNGDTFLTVWGVDRLSAGTAAYASLADAAGRTIRTFSVPVGSIPIAIGATYFLRVQDTLYAIDADGSTSIGFDLPASGDLYWNGRRLFQLVERRYPADQRRVAAYLMDSGGHVERLVEIAQLQPGARVAVTPTASGFAIALQRSGQTDVIRMSDAGLVTRQSVIGDDRYYLITMAANGDDVVLVSAQNEKLEWKIERGDGTIHRGGIAFPARSVVQAATAAPVGKGFVVNARRFSNVNGYEYETSSLLIDSDANLIRGPITIPAGGDSTFTNGRVAYTVGFDTKTVSAAVFDLSSPESASSTILSILPRRQVYPALASNGVDFLAGWTELAQDQNQFVSRTLRRDSIEPESRRAAQTWRQRSLAFNGSIYLAVWSDGSKIYAQRLTAENAPIDAVPTQLAEAPIYTDTGRWVAVTAAGSDFIVAWAANGLYDAVVHADGTFTQPRELVPAALTEIGYMSSANPWLASNGHDVVLAYTSVLSYPPPVLGNILSAATMVLGPDGAPLSGPTTLAPSGPRVRIASNGDDFLLTIDGNAETSMVRARVDAGKLTSSPATSLFSWFDNVASSITADGSDYVVALRYKLADGEVLSTFRIDAAGISAKRTTPVGRSEILEAPAIASNKLHDVLIATSEVAAGSDGPRIRAYFDDELGPMPSLPASPKAAFFSGRNAMAWTPADSNAAGYLVECESPYAAGYYYTATIVGRQATSALLTDSTRCVSFRVRSFNAAGRSDPVFATSPPRRRTAQHR